MPPDPIVSPIPMAVGGHKETPAEVEPTGVSATSVSPRGVQQKVADKKLSTHSVTGIVIYVKNRRNFTGSPKGLRPDLRDIP